MKIQITLISVVILFQTLGVWGQEPAGLVFPETKEGKRGAAFMQLLSSEDNSSIQKFIEVQMVVEKGDAASEREGKIERTLSMLAKSKLRKILLVSPDSVTFIIETTRGSIARVKINLDPKQDARIKDIGFERVPEDVLNEPTDEKKLSESEAIDAATSYLNKLYDDDKFSGSVLIAKNGKVILSRAYGFADHEKKIANSIDTKFNIGSINKVFTMLAIGLLADEGKLTLTDTIGKHLPEYPNKEAREKVNITHLLTMSSGIGDVFGDEYDATPKSKLRTISSYLPLFAPKPLSFQPGSDRQYSNGGFLVLGAIIEKASGQTYYDFVRDRLYKKIGMSDTDSYELDKVVPNLAQGYMFSESEKKRVNNTSTLPVRGSSGGGGYSNLADLLRFSNAIDSGTFKTPTSLRSVNDPLIKSLAEGNLSFGGGAPGINAVVINRIGSGYTVIVLANYDPPSASNISQRIKRWFDD